MKIRTLFNNKTNNLYGVKNNIGKKIKILKTHDKALPALQTIPKLLQDKYKNKQQKKKF